MAFAPATSVFGLIGFCGRVGREQEQLEMIAPFEQHYGDDWWYRTQLAFAQIELGQFDQGQRNIDSALAANPNSAHGAHIRGHLFYELGEREAGLAFLTGFMKDYAARRTDALPQPLAPGAVVARDRPHR
jgi:Tfp pilus assembly protein PilF